ncbi:hypothetical protein D1007_58825 [Hordeum vulgare]|nr:hypothetical protein D1007_58825 [Hordeum vulgare]
MTEEEVTDVMRHGMEDAMKTQDECQWAGLETALALSMVGNVDISELEMAGGVVEEEVEEEPSLAAWNPQLAGHEWRWSSTAPEMADSLNVGPWLLTRVYSSHAGGA